MGCLLDGTIERIARSDAAIGERVAKRWDAIAKPIRGLGLLESAITQIAAVQGRPEPDITRKALVVFCADNGFVEEGITQTGAEVTAQVADNMLEGKTTASICCKQAGADLYPVDIGMLYDTKIPNHRIANGTKNIAREPAMTRKEAILALEVGILLARELAEKGYTLLAGGEMGIGNTTTSSAIASVLLDRPVDEMTGRGAGLDDERLKKKISLIKKAIELHRPDREDPIDVLSKLGGFDIAGLAGLYLGAAAERIPVVLDGFISGVAALLACRLAPAAADALLASHVSREPAASRVLSALEKEPLLYASLNLGEGAGAVMLFPLLDAALRVFREMPSFTDTDIEAYENYQEKAR